MSGSASKEVESSFQTYPLTVRLPKDVCIERTNLRSLMAALRPEADWLEAIHIKKTGQGLAPHEADILCHYLAERLLAEAESL